MAIGSISIVGASRGLGAALAEAYASQGREVVGFARSASQPGVRVPVLGADINSVGSLGSLREWVKGVRGRRLIVMTAGVLGPVGGIGVVDVERWAEALKANLIGAVNVLHVLAPFVTSEDRVVFFTGGGVGGPRIQPRVSAYTASKAGLAVLLEEVASDDSFAAPVVGLAPGAFPTGFADEVLEVGIDVAGSELLEQVLRTQESEFDLVPVVRALDFIEGPEGSVLNGRIVSAQRDDLAEACSLCSLSNDVFRLRRVDDRSVRVVEPW